MTNPPPRGPRCLVRINRNHALSLPDLIASTHQPLLASITSLKARRAHQLSATQASLQPLPAGAAVTGLASQYLVSQQATGIERATPNHRLEEHGCRPRSPGHIQQVGIEPVANFCFRKTWSDKALTWRPFTPGSLASGSRCRRVGSSSSGPFRSEPYSHTASCANIRDLILG